MREIELFGIDASDLVITSMDNMFSDIYVLNLSKEGAYAIVHFNDGLKIEVVRSPHWQFFILDNPKKLCYTRAYEDDDEALTVTSNATSVEVIRYGHKIEAILPYICIATG